MSQNSELSSITQIYLFLENNSTKKFKVFLKRNDFPFKDSASFRNYMDCFAIKVKMTLDFKNQEIKLPIKNVADFKHLKELQNLSHQLGVRVCLKKTRKNNFCILAISKNT